MLDRRSLELQQDDQVGQDGVVDAEVGGAVEVEHVERPDGRGEGEAVDQQGQLPPLPLLDAVPHLELPEGSPVSCKGLGEVLLCNVRVWMITNGFFVFVSHYFDCFDLVTHVTHVVTTYNYVYNQFPNSLDPCPT